MMFATTSTNQKQGLPWVQELEAFRSSFLASLDEMVENAGRLEMTPSFLVRIQDLKSELANVCNEVVVKLSANPAPPEPQEEASEDEFTRMVANLYSEQENVLVILNKAYDAKVEGVAGRPPRRRWH